MRRHRIGQFRLLLLSAFVLCVLCGCGLNIFNPNGPSGGSSENKVTSGANVVTKMVTYTPTPTIHPEPVDENPVADAQSIRPSFSGEPEAVWRFAVEAPIDKKLVEKETASASFKILWSENMLFVQVHVLDDTPDTSAEDASNQDSVWFFINESCEMPDKYGVGDAFYVVNRDGAVAFGTGASENQFLYCTYPDGEQGYYVEVGIPILTKTLMIESTIGFDVRVVNARDGKVRTKLQFADTSGYTEYTLGGVATLAFE